ncbi:MAG: hypothetical protein JWO94_51 [Verrucomicrobiaceae bacterium]|nr:hypothetical protein [Verrucomicrobiaceae bacterium]
MEPFTPDDPLWKLMGKARPAVPRPNFSQNVLRAVRQGRQSVAWHLRLGEWFAARHRPILGGVAALAVALVTYGVWPNNDHAASSSAPMASAAPAAQMSDAEMAAIADEDVSAPLDSLDHMDALVAMEDTSKLTDTELQFLLY